MKNFVQVILTLLVLPYFSYAQLFGGQLKPQEVSNISALDCNFSINSGTLTEGVTAVGVSSVIPYSGGDGSSHNGQTVNSTGVTGLTATLLPGNFATGLGNLTYAITGTASTLGTAVFAVSIGGQTCNLNWTVVPFQPQYPAGSVFCASGATAVVDVLNPTTGKTWMDRNLGASQVAVTSNDPNSYGDLYQWGRRSDGHQCRNSATTITLSSTDQPSHGDFILAPNSPFDWRSPQNVNLWQGVNGVNNPCPSGYRIPTNTELNAERSSWSTNNAAGAFASPLKLTRGGGRDITNGSIYNLGVYGYYWSSNVNNNESINLYFLFNNAIMSSYNRSDGFSVRCIKDFFSPQGAINTLDCGSATNNGTLTSGTAASGVSSIVPYTGGNGGTHNGQTVTSTGVTGLSATLTAGTFANGAGSLTYTISGTASASGTASFALNIGGQTCTLTRTVDLPASSITALICGSATNNGTLTAGTAASGVSSLVPYSGGNGDTHIGQTVTSTGVTGLTATLAAGTFANGAGTLTYTITGTPSASGTANFALNIGGQSCILNILVNAVQPAYPAGTVHCNAIVTIVNDVTNPITGKTWMDRNLGASQVATSSADAAAYGDLYQWGRRSDGHQCRNSNTTSTLSSTDQPMNGNFILTPNSPFDWRNPQNTNLWQGINGINNPCPIGYRIPTSTELDLERSTWINNNLDGAFDAQLKLTAAGARSRTNGSITGTTINGFIWSSSVSSTNANGLTMNSGSASITAVNRALGGSVRCLKDVSSPQGSINNLDCGAATNIGTLTAGTAASGVSSIVPYTGGNGGTHSGQTVTSTGVTSLTATLAAGTFANGAGTLTYTITGTPSASGTASFVLNIGGQTCSLNLTVSNSGGSGTYPPGSVFCTGTPTAIVDVTNPSTGSIWMDRNLGATQVATSITDANSYGDLYQWGRRSDGHQCRTSPTTSSLSSTNQPANGNFILAPGSPYDWRSPQNSNLWQGVNGTNNPCPSGYRLPTETEINTERLSWGSNNAAGAFASPLKLPAAGYRSFSFGSLNDLGTYGSYWSSTVSSINSRFLDFYSSGAIELSSYRAYGLSVRCIKD
jgi:uncharacterized protein (TIGR02145 family)